MTTQQPDPLRVAAELDCHNANLDRQAAKAIRTQHKQIAAYKLLTESQEAQLSQHRAQADKYHEAIATLQSERDANALLTTAIERKDALLRRALDAVENVNTTMPFLVAHELRQAITKELQ